MKKDYHIHPQILQNPAGFDAFAKVCMEQGIEEVCITDHMPLKGSSAKDRIPEGKVGLYCKHVREIANSYQGKLSVKLGIEIDFHPSLRTEIESVLGQGAFDFVLGSSHLHAIKQLNIFETCRSWRGYAEAMYENTRLAVESGYFHAIAHMDMYHWIFGVPERFLLEADDFAEQDYAKEIGNLLEEIKAREMYLEINPHLAAVKNKVDATYPSCYITQLALEKGVKCCYGSDAHVPEQVGVLLPVLRTHPIYGQAIRSWEEQ